MMKIGRKLKDYSILKTKCQICFFALLERMVQGGILEKDEEELREYRWNKGFTGTHFWKMKTF